MDNVNFEMGRWFDKVEKALNNHIPKTRYKILAHPRLTENIRRIKVQYNPLQQEVQQNQWTVHYRNILKNLQDHLQELCKQERDNKWNEMINKIDIYKDPAEFWKEIKRLMGSDTGKPPYILDNNGR